MAKTVVRKYVNKKGEVVVKTYTYNKAYNKIKPTSTIVYKSGKLHQTNFNNEYNRLLTTEGATEADLFKKSVIELQTRIKQGHRDKRATLKTLQAVMSTNRINKILINFNTDAQEVAELISNKYNVVVTEDYILNEANWVKNSFGKPSSKINLPNGIVVELEFDYDNMVLV